jgi:hypothetical protein
LVLSGFDAQHVVAKNNDAVTHSQLPQTGSRRTAFPSGIKMDTFPHQEKVMSTVLRPQ